MNHPWQDPDRTPLARAEALLAQLTLEEKLAQLGSIWPGSDTGAEDTDVAPLQHQVSNGQPDLADLLPHGLGQLTRPFGTLPVDPTEKAKLLAEDQRRIVAAGRFGIPALAHEECLTGFTAWQATIFPTPLAWGATFHPELVEHAARLIGESMRSVGIHQGLSPVLDVARDPRWGRTEETIGEDPYLVATVATGYVRGLESAGVVATLKHFVGYSASHAGRNHAPVAIGPRELADLLLPPFELALRDGGARSVMAAYNDLDGVPASADPELLTGLLREEWGFTGTVVSDYFGISFLEVNHGVAGSPGEAAALALAAGVDVELPAQRAYGPPLLAAVRAGEVAEELVDRSVLRVLTQKAELGLLDADYSPEPAAVCDGERVDLDPPAMRAVARQLAEESVILLANRDGALPLADTARIAVAGPLADAVAPLLGCYTFPRHVGVQHPELPLGVAVPTLFEALAAELPTARVTRATSAAETAGADVVVAVVGDRSGLFGRGTSGEGCDAADLELPDGQGALLDELVAGEVPVVLVALTGRPYALGRWADRLAGVVQAFFPGEEGAGAVAGVLSGRLNPSGRLPIGVPRGSGGQPANYLAPPLGQAGEASNLDPTPLYPFGHGIGYTDFAWTDPAVSAATVATDGEVTVALTVTNTGDRDGTEVVQLYLHDPVARIARPVNRLVGYARVPLAAGASARVSFAFHADLAGYTPTPGRRIVDPGALELRLGASVADLRHTLPLTVTGPERRLGHDRRMTCPATITPATGA
ncbi:glycoside hydrolase family 3 N-terminal domain-containing protein [Streptomyces sp. DSM 44915]|uniref:Glycoside hydrolase family 3 N-terminal domain-containing protein n=1 Tax=Streptomyces chisholmiae TaxID=3075540 RepID=A0ABU2K0C0_9ACTN|nr:glycoside hydrolase family 3 N-terminal domain-containing protein [Streptomyces sp. DSM 44915]MDT0270705.1 glycoside hydrolase family 3 N-terminal domain-containing protein [Streptomyces sp. DSM 44915]